VSPFPTLNGRCSADSLFDDDDAASGRCGRILHRTATVPVHGRSRRRLHRRNDRETFGHHDHGDYAWPGTWNLERDETTGRSTVTWRGASALKFPGRLRSHEQLVYHVDDAHPADAAVEGDGESVETWRIGSSPTGASALHQRCDHVPLRLYPRVAARRIPGADTQLAGGHSARPAVATGDGIARDNADSHASVLI